MLYTGCRLSSPTKTATTNNNKKSNNNRQNPTHSQMHARKLELFDTYSSSSASTYIYTFYLAICLFLLSELCCVLCLTCARHTPFTFFLIIRVNSLWFALSDNKDEMKWMCLPRICIATMILNYNSVVALNGRYEPGATVNSSWREIKKETDLNRRILKLSKVQVNKNIFDVCAKGITLW